MRKPVRWLILCALSTLAFAAPAVAAEVEISDQAFVRHDDGTDITIQSCNSDFSDQALDGPRPTLAADEGGGERQQNEPSAAVDPMFPAHQVAGANEYCPTPTIGDAWAGFYYSSSGGASWTNSLVPGYPTDTSVEGMASPAYRFVGAMGDPVQAWDRWGHVYYGTIGFNRQKPNNGSIFMARYNWPSSVVATTPDYEFTTLVSRGVPGFGQFEDKVQLEVDRGTASPYAGSPSRPFGNVYMCWTRFTGSGANNFVEFGRSTDGGRTFDVQKISESVHGSQFCDIAVTRTGVVFVAWRQFAFFPDRGQMQDNAVVWVKSTDGGRSFTKPDVAVEFTGWDLTDRFGSPAEAGQAAYQNCLNADYSLSGCAGPEPRNHARSCGDGPFRCLSGYVFFRANTQVRITADPVAGDGDGAYIVYDPSVPGSLTPTGTTYGTVVSGTGSQASIYFIKTTDGGATWRGGTGVVGQPTRIDAEPVGHQFFPDIDADNGELHAVWQDSRYDCASGPPSTPSGGDFRTVPISNRWVAAKPPGSVACSPGGTAASNAPGLTSFYAVSTDGGVSWLAKEVATFRQMPQYEQFGNRDTPFFGDYNYISAEGGTVLMDWTDQREVVPGTDPRYDDPMVAPDDGTDGFDVWQCRTPVPGGGFSADGCPNAGGLDQSIWGYFE